jgi:hypothetical protein
MEGVFAQRRQRGDAPAKPAPVAVGPASPPVAGAGSLDFFVQDVEAPKGNGANGNGTLLLWGCTHDASHTLCLRVTEFAHSCFVRAPLAAGGGALREADVAAVREALAAALSCDASLLDVELCARTPVLYFRPAAPDAVPFLRLALRGSRPTGVAAAAARLAADDALTPHGLSWPQFEAFEETVKPLQRFLVDSGLCGGGWARLALADAAVVPAAERLSRCNTELLVPWRALTPLTPDAAQQSDASHAAHLSRLLQGGGPAAAAAAAGAVPALRTCLLDVQLACVPANGNGGGGAAPPTRTPNALTDPIVLIACILTPLPHGGAPPRATAQLLFTWGNGGAVHAAPPGVELRCFASERAMLAAFARWLTHEADPCLLGVYQVRENIGAVVTRWEKLRMGPLLLGRHATQAATLKSVVQYSPT